MLKYNSFIEEMESENMMLLRSIQRKNSERRKNSSSNRRKTVRNTVPERHSEPLRQDEATNTITAAFAAVLGQRDITDVIQHLSAEAALDDLLLPFFIAEAQKLAPLERIEDAITKKSVARSGNLNVNVLAPQIAQGTYGVLYRSEDGRRIYKSITITAPLRMAQHKKRRFFEQQIRNIYIETLIQTILACDPDVGSNICRPLQLFRDPKTIGHDKHSKPSKHSESHWIGNWDGEDAITFYILMEPIKFTLPSFVEHKHGIQLEWFAPFLKQLGHTLDVLKRKYNFTHRDLHSNNVMMDTTGTLKLIDFGFSCLEFRGLHYHNIDVNELESVKCIPGFDLAIFFAAFFESFYDEIHENPAVKTIFSRKYFICRHEGDVYNFFALADALNKDNPHFAFYHFLIKPLTRKRIEHLPILKPDVLERVADGILSGVDYAPAITFPV